MGLWNAIDPLYSLCGLLVGLLVGMTGVGGGSLMTPLLVLAFGIHPAAAVGTDLLYASITKAFGTATHGLCGNVDWRIFSLLAAGSLPSAGVTVSALYVFGDGGMAASRLISAVLAATLIVTALSLFFRHWILARATRWFGPIQGGRAGWATLGLGAVIGVLVSLSSIGAGAIGITALFILYPVIPVARIVGTDIAHAAVLSLVAGVGHWMLGTVIWPLLGSLLLGSLPGICAGSLAATKIPERVLRPILAGALMVVASQLLITL